MSRVRILFLAVLLVAASGCAYVTRASVSSTGTESNGDTGLPALSGDGRYVAFTSAADDLVAGDGNGAPDVFVHDNLTGTTERVSVTSSGAEVHGTSNEAAISLDGRYVAFVSTAPDVVAGDTNGTADVFVRDRVAGTTTRVSVMPDGSQDTVDATAPSITFDAHWVVWAQAHSPTSFDVIERDLQTSTSVFVASDSPYQRAVISADGNVVAMTGDCNGTCTGQLAERQRSVDPTVVAPVQTAGVVPDFTSLAVNGFGGRYIVYHATPSTPADPPTGLYVADLVGNHVQPVSTGNGDGTDVDASQPTISLDGRYVAFTSLSPDLVDPDTNGVQDVFVRDRTDKLTERVSTTRVGDQLSSASSNPSISADGRYLAFKSAASNLVDNDTNSVGDVFVKYAHTPAVAAVNGVLSGYPLPRGTTDKQIIVEGTDFMPNPTVAFGHGVTVTKVDYFSTQILVATVSVDPNADTGSRDVVVIDPGTGPGPNTGAAGACIGCVTIT